MAEFEFVISARSSSAPSDVLAEALRAREEVVDASGHGGDVDVRLEADDAWAAEAVLTSVIYNDVSASVRTAFVTDSGAVRVRRKPAA